MVKLDTTTLTPHPMSSNIWDTSMLGKKFTELIDPVILIKSAEIDLLPDIYIKFML